MFLKYLEIDKEKYKPLPRFNFVFQISFKNGCVLKTYLKCHISNGTIPYHVGFLFLKIRQTPLNNLLQTKFNNLKD